MNPFNKLSNSYQFQNMKTENIITAWFNYGIHTNKTLLLEMENIPNKSIETKKACDNYFKLHLKVYQIFKYNLDTDISICQKSLYNSNFYKAYKLLK